LEMQRGGGTDFVSALIEADRLAPSLIVVLTDLEAPIPPAPNAPVGWVTPRPTRVPPPFGDLVILDPTAAS